jgi:hypothetical protein
MSSRLRTAVAISWFHKSRHEPLSSNPTRLSNEFCTDYSLMQAIVELAFVLQFVSIESVRHSKVVYLTFMLHIFRNVEDISPLPSRGYKYPRHAL